MKIFLIVHQFPPERFGGAERHVAQLAGVLHSRHELMVYTQTVDPHSSLPAAESAEPYGVRRWMDRSLAAEPALAKDLLNTCAAFAPDVVHVHHGIGFPPRVLFELTQKYLCVLTLHDYWWICPRIRLLFKGETPCAGPAPISRCVKCYRGEAAGALAGEAAGLLGSTAFAPLANFARGRMNGNSKPEAPASGNAFARALEWSFIRKRFFAKRNAFDKKILNRFREAISPSQYLLGRYAEAGLRAFAERAHVIPYGIDPAETPNAARGPATLPLRFGLIGHFSREKGLPLAVRAFREVDPSKATLDVHGATELDPGLAREVEVNPAVRLRGPFEPARLGEIFSGMDVLLVPSIWVENAPKVLHEAHAAGVPVIAASGGALPEFVGKGRGGWLFHAQDALSIEAMVRSLIENPEEIERARQTVPKPDPIEKTAREIEKIYDRTRRRY